MNPCRFATRRRWQHGICGIALIAFWLIAACVSPGPHLRHPPTGTGAMWTDTAAMPQAPGPMAETLQGKNGALPTHTQYVDVGDAWLRVLEAGSPTAASLPLILVHGYGSRLEVWGDIQAQLARSRRVIAYDQRGFGLSERPAGAYGPAQHALDLVALLDHFQIDRAIVVGHSYGGGVAMRAALQHPERIAGLGFVDAFLLDEQVPRSFRWAKVPILGELLFGAFYREVPGEKYLLAFHDQERFVSVAALDEQRELMSQPGSLYAALETVRGMDYHEVEDRYGQVAVPMLILWGEEDRVTPLAAGKRLAARLDGADFVVLPGSGHVPSWERPQGLLRFLRPFLASVDGESAENGTPLPATPNPPVGAEGKQWVAPGAHGGAS